MQVLRWTKRHSYNISNKRTCVTKGKLDANMSIAQNGNSFDCKQYMAIVLDDSDSENESCENWLDAKSIYDALASPSSWYQIQGKMLKTLGLQP